MDIKAFPAAQTSIVCLEGNQGPESSYVLQDVNDETCFCWLSRHNGVTYIR